MMLWQLFTSYFSLSLLPLYSRIHLPQLVFSLKRKGKHQSLRVNILSNADLIVLAQEYKRRSHFFLFYLHLTSATRNDRRGDMHGRQILKGNHVHDVPRIPRAHSLGSVWESRLQSSLRAVCRSRGNAPHTTRSVLGWALLLLPMITPL